MPLHRDGYLVAPVDAPLDPALATLLTDATVEEPTAEHQYSVYWIDGRLRQKLPLSVPISAIADGTVFLGHQLEPRPDGSLSVLTAWQLPDDGVERRIWLRLRRTGDLPVDRLVEASLDGGLFDQPYVAVRLVMFEPPPPGSRWDLSVALIDRHGNPVLGSGVDQAGFRFLNRYQFEP